jgi:formylglycine-generating enzyme required for sulfatase activity
MDFSRLGIDLVPIPSGTFYMGSTNEGFSEAPAHVVRIVRPYRLGRFPVTQAQWSTVCGSHPSEFPLTGRHPVESVSWLDAVRFCQLLSEQTGCVVRLPSEAEWEHACRGNTETDFFFTSEGPFADPSAVPLSVQKQLSQFAWFENNSRESSHPVGLKRANPFGLQDMIGNVWEWCADFWHRSYRGAPIDGAAWLEPPNDKSIRCLRGGAWDMSAFRCRSSYRSWDREIMATSRIGFRICVE